MLKMKRVLVTGANGFIGRHLIKRLTQDGFIVRAMVRDDSKNYSWGQNVEVVKGDVKSPQSVYTASTGCEILFHLAGKVHELSGVQKDEKEHFAINVEGTRNVLEGAIGGGAQRFIFFSSVKAMGEETFGCNDETVEPDPITPYGRSKLAAENLVFDYGKRFHLQTTCLRLPLVYGPSNKGNLYRMVSAIDRGLFPPLPELDNRRSMVHVSNVVEAALLATTLSIANGKCYIVTDLTPYSTREVIEMIYQGLGKGFPRWHVPLGVLKLLGRIGDYIGRVQERSFFFNSGALNKLIGSAWYSSEKISQELGYHPSITFEEALPEWISWYRKEQR